MAESKVQVTTTPEPWHAAYPPPSSKTVSSITPAELLLMLQNGQLPGRDFLLIDLRRTDHEGGTIRGSLNLPAQSLYPSLHTLYEICSQAGISTVIWYCGSSRGRGNRSAGWFQDLHLTRGNTQMKSLILLGGIRGWATAGREYELHMDEYRPNVWLQDQSEA